jgi:hypothetical protein
MVCPIGAAVNRFIALAGITTSCDDFRALKIAPLWLLINRLLQSIRRYQNRDFRYGPQAKIIVYVTTSADGFIGRSDGSVDWLDRPRPKGNYGMAAFYRYNS